MSTAFGLRELLADHPRLHRSRAGDSITLQLSEEALELIEAQVGEGQRTLETGAGVSTVLFALRKAEHVCITPDAHEIDAIRRYCAERGISLAATRFELGRSEQLLPRLELPPLDLVLIDGRHAFPSPFIDWYYAATRLKVGGLLIVDDTQLRTGHILRDFLAAEPEWRLERDWASRAALFRKLAEGSHDKEWNRQPYVVRGSEGAAYAGLRRTLGLVRRGRFAGLWRELAQRFAGRGTGAQRKGLRALFYAGVAGSMLFGFLKYNAVMPVPLVDFESLDAGYFMHAHRWAFRGLFALLIAAGAWCAFRTGRKWLPALALGLALACLWAFNVRFSAEGRFDEPEHLVFGSRADNRVGAGRLVIAVEHNGEAKAYPIRFLVFHHQVRDTIGGRPIVVTYCNTCRTARVYEPIVDGRETSFRLVGMHRFNSVYEDMATGSWWQQANGKAVAGPQTGHELRELPSTQLTVAKWLELRPDGKVMQMDEDSSDDYPAVALLERESGASARGSWQEESWVVGVEVAGASKAYDWASLQRTRIVNDRVSGRPIVVALAGDGRSVAAFERPPESPAFELQGDLLTAGERAYDFAGRELGSPGQLEHVDASQEFWRCRREFYPQTERWALAPG